MPFEARLRSFSAQEFSYKNYCLSSTCPIFPFKAPITHFRFPYSILKLYYFYTFFEFCSRFKNSCSARFFKPLNLSLHVTILFNLTYCCDWFKNNGFWFECFLILHFQSLYVHTILFKLLSLSCSSSILLGAYPDDFIFLSCCWILSCAVIFFCLYTETHYWQS